MAYTSLRDRHYPSADDECFKNDTDIHEFVKAANKGTVSRCYLMFNFECESINQDSREEVRSIAPGVEGLKAYLRLPRSQRFGVTGRSFIWKTPEGTFTCNKSIEIYDFSRLWALLDFALQSGLKLEACENFCPGSDWFKTLVHFAVDDLPF